MLGVLVLFGLLVLLLFRLLRIASISRDVFGRYLVIGLTMMIFFQRRSISHEFEPGACGRLAAAFDQLWR